MSLFSAGFVYSDRRGRWSPLAKGKRNIEMKKLVVVAMAAAALSAAAMPTEAEFAKASKDVQTALKAQITSWQKGELADGDLAALMLMNAGKFKDEARHYACLQAAFAAAVRAGDAVLAANAIEKIAADTKDFGAAEERRLVKKVLEKATPEKSKGFLRALEVERAKIVYATPVSDAAAATIAKMKTIVVPSVSFKPPTTLADAVAFLSKASKEYDPSDNAVKGVKFFLLSSKEESRELPKVPMIRTNNIRLYDLLVLVVDAVGYDFEVKGDVVLIFRNAKDVAPSDNVAVARMKQIRLPMLDVQPMTPLKDVLELLHRDSKVHDPRKVGVNFVLKTSNGETVPPVPKIRATDLSVYNALDLIVGSVDCDFEVKGDSVVIFKKGGTAKK